MCTAIHFTNFNNNLSYFEHCALKMCARKGLGGLVNSIDPSILFITKAEIIQPLNLINQVEIVINN